MIKKINFALFLFTLFSVGQHQNPGINLVINEIDVDQENTDTLEFIELFTPTPNTSLDGYIVVLFNGGTTANPENRSYRVVALEGHSTDANGFLIIGDDAVPNAAISLGASNTIQNGPDAVAIYADDASNFPNGTPPTTVNLIDAIVYGTGDNDDTDLLLALDETIQFDEDLNGNSETESLQREENGDYCTALPTLDAVTFCPICKFTFTQIYTTCDTHTSGTDTVTISLDFEGGGGDTFTISLIGSNGTIGGDDPTFNTTGTLLVTGIDEASNIVIQLESLNCSILQEVVTPICNPIFSVATVAELRNSRLDRSYRITGEVILTFQQSYRNQKFMEDHTAGILLDDPDNIITSTFSIGDGITEITGVLEENNGMLFLKPIQDPSPASSSGNAVRPKQVSLAVLDASPEDFESQYVQISQGVTIDPSEFTTWIPGETYKILNPEGVFYFRALFPDADYMGMPVPTTTVALAGIVTQQSTNGYFITSRTNDDVHGILGTHHFTDTGIIIYPNPVINGNLYMECTNTSELQITMYSLSGTTVLKSTTTTGTLDVSRLKKGFYLIRIEQEGQKSVKKLIVQ